MNNTEPELFIYDRPGGHSIYATVKRTVPFKLSDTLVSMIDDELGIKNCIPNLNQVEKDIFCLFLELRSLGSYEGIYDSKFAYYFDNLETHILSMMEKMPIKDYIIPVKGNVVKGYTLNTPVIMVNTIT